MRCRNAPSGQHTRRIGGARSCSARCASASASGSNARRGPCGSAGAGGIGAFRDQSTDSHSPNRTDLNGDRYIDCDIHYDRHVNGDRRDAVNRRVSGTQVTSKERRLDEIDDQLLALLAERGDLVHANADAPPRFADSNLEPTKQQERIKALHRSWEAHRSSKFPEGALDAVFREILSACASVLAPVRVAYLGPPGTFSHLAGLQSFGASCQLVECSTIANVFMSVERGEAQYGVVPIENLIEGGVTPTHDCLLRTQLMICSEMILVVRLCLVANHNDMGAIERVYSHPQPLAQSRIWLSTHLPRAESVACTSTTAAAQRAATDPRSAAVTSILSAELYGLNVLAEGIEDVPGNATRFVTITREDAPPTGDDKTTVVFSTPDERGALVRILSIFDSEGLNLSRIESRPDRTRRWEYVFFTDIEGHRSHPAMERALKRVQSQCQMVQILGSYPRAKLSTV